MQRSRLSLKWLEVFEQAARSGSAQIAARELDLSVSTVSHHLLSLEQSLGVDLLDHSRRPMVLTTAGIVFLRYTEEALRLIRRGESEVVSGNLAEAQYLRLGLVEDFDSEVAPELAQLLAQAMPKCTFRHLTRPSHEILRLLCDQKLDAGVATRPVADMPGLIEYPLLRDPFVLACPASSNLSPEIYLAGEADIPFLRYPASQLIGSQIERQLRRIKVDLPNRFEIESNQSIMGMVADGRGWTITTPASFARARRFHSQVELCQFPGKQFSRTLSLFTTDLYAVPMAEIISATLRRLINTRLVMPVTQQTPWLTEMFYLVSEAGISTR